MTGEVSEIQMLLIPNREVIMYMKKDIELFLDRPSISAHDLLGPAV